MKHVLTIEVKAPRDTALRREAQQLLAELLREADRVLQAYTSLAMHKYHFDATHSPPLLEPLHLFVPQLQQRAALASDSALFDVLPGARPSPPCLSACLLT